LQARLLRWQSPALTVLPVDRETKSSRRNAAQPSGSQSALVRRVIGVERLECAIKNWPAGGWHATKVFREYNLALTRGVAGGRFLRWFEQAN
jgi:hypothetical protein